MLTVHFTSTRPSRCEGHVNSLFSRRRDGLGDIRDRNQRDYDDGANNDIDAELQACQRAEDRADQVQRPK